jgi:predicted transcriptional regulator of viral defense system
MRAQVASREVRIAKLAAAQHGVVTYRQLADLGLGRSAIQYRREVGRLHTVHRAVYAVGHPLTTVRGRWMAAVLACGDGSTLSHRNAAAHLELLPYSGSRIHVTTVHHRSTPDIVVHRVRHLPDDDRTLIDGIPVTSVARTFVDIAPIVRIDQLQRAIEAAERQGVFDLRALERRMMPRALRGALADYFDPGFVRSELERRFARLCRDAGIPAPGMNIWICGQEVDAV